MEDRKTFKYLFEKSHHGGRGKNIKKHSFGIGTSTATRRLAFPLNDLTLNLYTIAMDYFAKLSNLDSDAALKIIVDVALEQDGKEPYTANKVSAEYAARAQRS